MDLHLGKTRCSDLRATQAVQELQSFELHLSNSDPESLRQGPMSDLETLLDRAIQPELKQSSEPELSQPASKPQPAATGFVLEVGAFGRGSSAPAVPAVRKGILKAASSLASLDQFMTRVKAMNNTKAAKPEAAKVAEPSEPEVAQCGEPVAEPSEAAEREVAEPTAEVAQCSEPVAEPSKPAVARCSEPVAEPSKAAAEVARCSEPEVALCSEPVVKASAEEEPEPFVNGELGEPLKEFRDYVVARQDFEHFGPDCPQEAVKRFRDCLYSDEKDRSNSNPSWLVLEFPAQTPVAPLPEWNGAMAFALREGDPTNFLLVSKNKGVAVRADNVFKVKKDCLATLFSAILLSGWQRGNIRIFEKAAYYSAKDQGAQDFSPRAALRSLEHLDPVGFVSHMAKLEDRFGGDTALRTRKRKVRSVEEYIYVQREALNKLRKAVDDEKEAAKSTLSIADFNYETCQCWFWHEPSGRKKSAPLDEAVAAAIQTKRTLVLSGPFCIATTGPHLSQAPRFSASAAGGTRPTAPDHTTPGHTSASDSLLPRDGNERGPQHVASSGPASETRGWTFPCCMRLRALFPQTLYWPGTSTRVVASAGPD